MNDDQQKFLLKKKDLAERLGVCQRQIELWMRDKKIPYIKMGRRCILFDPDDVVKALKQQEVPQTQE